MGSAIQSDTKPGDTSKPAERNLPGVTGEADRYLQQIEGNMETPAITDWSSLPDDMVYKILGSLSLWELAHISATCKQLYQIFRRNLIKEQRARCDLAIQRYGKQRVSRIADVIKRFVKGQPVDSGGKGGTWWFVSDDGKLHGEENPSRRRALRDATLKAGDVDVTLDMYSPECMEIVVPSSTGSRLSIFLLPNLDVCQIYLRPCGVDDTEGVALVQALLSGVFAEQDWPRPRVFIRWNLSRDGFTHAGLQTQIGPLLPLTLVYKVQ